MFIFWDVARQEFLDQEKFMNYSTHKYPWHIFRFITAAKN